MIKKRENRKGFTLIELLATIAIISLVMIGVGFGVVQIIKNSKTEANKVTTSNIKKAAINYVQEFKKPTSWKSEQETTNEYACTTIQELINKGYLKDNLVDEDGKKIENDTIIKVIRDENKVITGDVDINSNDCDKTPPELELEVYEGIIPNTENNKYSDNVTVDGAKWYIDDVAILIKKDNIKTPIQALKIKIGTKEISFNDETSTTYDEYVETYTIEGENYIIDIEDMTTSEERNSLGANTNICAQVTNENGISSEESCIKVNIDYVTPSEPILTSSDGKSSGSWHSNNFNINISSSAEKMSPSGVVYKYGTNVENLTNEGNTISVQTETNGTIYYVKTCSKVDKNNRCSEASQYNVKLDKTPPEVTSATQIPTSNVKDFNYTAYFKDSLSGLIKYKLTTESSYTNSNWTTISATTEQKSLTKNINSNGKYYLWLEDYAGNKSSRLINVTNIDNQGPVLTSSNVASGTITTTYTDATPPITTYYIVNNTGTTPSSSSFTSTTNTFTVDCGKTYYAYAKAVDKLGNYTISNLGSVSSDSCCSEGTFTKNGICSSEGFIQEERYNECTGEYEYRDSSTTCQSACYDYSNWSSCNSTGWKYKDCYYKQGGINKVSSNYTRAACMTDTNCTMDGECPNPDDPPLCVPDDPFCIEPEPETPILTCTYWYGGTEYIESEEEIDCDTSEDTGTGTISRDEVYDFRYIGCDEYYITTCDETYCEYTEKNGNTSYYGEVLRSNLRTAASGCSSKTSYICNAFISSVSNTGVVTFTMSQTSEACKITSYSKSGSCTKKESGNYYVKLDFSVVGLGTACTITVNTQGIGYWYNGVAYDYISWPTYRCVPPTGKLYRYCTDECGSVACVNSSG